MYPGETALEHGPAGLEETLERVGALLVIPQGGVGLELGTQYGTHADLILQVCKPAHLTLVDIWNDPGIYEVALNRFRNMDEVTIRRKRTDEVVTEFDDESFDFIYIDADHGYPAVTDDIKNYLPKLKPGGWMLAHDYKPCYGVKKAVDEAIDADNGITFVGFANDRMHTVIFRKWDGSVDVK
jgi:predicted O-methyltransferase YrrM